MARAPLDPDGAGRCPTCGRRVPTAIVGLYSGHHPACTPPEVPTITTDDDGHTWAIRWRQDTAGTWALTAEQIPRTGDTERPAPPPRIG